MRIVIANIDPETHLVFLNAIRKLKGVEPLINLHDDQHSITS